MARPRIGKAAMTGAERVRRHRLQKAVTKPATLEAQVRELEASKAFSYVLWIGDNLDPVTPPCGLPAALACARQGIEVPLKARAGRTEDTVALLKAELVEKGRRIAELEAQLARTKDGLLFNIHSDTINDIADAVVRNVSAHRAVSMGNALIKRAAKKSQVG